MQVPGKSSGVDGESSGVLAASRRGPTVLWSARIAWLAVAAFCGAPIADAVADRSSPVQMVVAVGLWTLWGAVATALLVPSTASLTIIRSVAPLATVATAVSAAGAATAVQWAVGMASGAVAGALAASGEFGQVFVQASAYGEERRFLLRPPVGSIIPAIVSWLLACTAIMVGPPLLAARNWVPGVVVGLAGGAACWFLAPRFHQLSRRWLVLVPAGVVIHDRTVLADTVMIATRNIVGVSLAYADTEAADLTGPAAGHAVQLSFDPSATVVLAPTRDRPGGTALHVRSVLVAPSRPGAFLAAAGANRLPIG